jgi:pyruvate dehydrogenase E1 component alpha subunit
MHGESVDGQDVFIVRDAISRAIERARGEKTPSLIEMRTYRFVGHSMSDAVSGTYRAKTELENEMKRDPIHVLRSRMEDSGEIDEQRFVQLDEEVKAEVQDSWDFADASPEPPVESLYANVYADSES